MPPQAIRLRTQLIGTMRGALTAAGKLALNPM
jgi:hypothetical protein